MNNLKDYPLKDIFLSIISTIVFIPLMLAVFLSWVIILLSAEIFEIGEKNGF